MNHKMNIKLTADELNDLRVFLERTSLKGSEVPQFLAIVKALQKAKEDKSNK